MSDTIIENPTYMEHIRHFFDDDDLAHMFNRGVDLTTYPTLKAEASRVFQITRPPDAEMPPEEDRKWSPERHKSFMNWMVDGFPLGRPTPAEPQSSTGDRVRKDARDLSGDELDQLRRAFQGIMDLPAGDPAGYFALAGQHWYPKPGECLHHEDRYHSWHRVFLHRFEDALRAVPGCADVTVPYWDITAAPPAFLFTAPFDSYTAVADIHIDLQNPDQSYPTGYETSRFDADTIVAEVARYGIPGKIDNAIAQFDWAEFTDGIEKGGHDNGHVASGPTLSVPDAAAFDPLFWFFHSNWDRLWWEWQQIMRATTQWSFRSTVVSGNTEFLTRPFNDLPPFADTAEQAIDLTATGVGYALPATREEGVIPMAAPTVDYASYGSLAASRHGTIRSASRVSVRLKGIERLAIPGSFRAVLRADGEPIALQAFFQSTEPTACSGCRDKPVVDLDFEVDADAVVGRRLTADLEVMTPGAERIGRGFPLRSCGNPTLNLRLLIEDVP